MIILGIDPGIEKVGFAVLERKKEKFFLLDYGIIKTSSKDSFFIRLLQIKENINEILKDFKINLCAIEKIFFGTNVNTAIPVAHSRGVLVTEIFEKGIEIFEFSPNEMKSIVCGNGKAEKFELQKMIMYHLNLDKKIPQDDANDAIGLALSLGFNYEFLKKVENFKK